MTLCHSRSVTPVAAGCPRPGAGRWLRKRTQTGRVARQMGHHGVPIEQVSPRPRSFGPVFAARLPDLPVTPCPQQTALDDRA